MTVPPAAPSTPHAGANISAPFILRPVATSLLMIAILLVGLSGYKFLPLTALPQFGPAWATAYQTAPELLQNNPHVRLDVTQWLDVDG